MRDTSNWYGKLAEELKATELMPKDMSPKEFFSVELGLFFLTEHYPDEPVGALWPLMSTYVACRPGLHPVLRRLRLLMGEVGRSNFFPLCLDKYRKASPRVRGFERTDDPVRRVTDTSTFCRQDVTHGHTRWDTYREVLSSPVPYAATEVRDPAEPGEVYTFARRDGRVETVTIPNVKAPPPPRSLTAVPRRQRQARWIDRTALRKTAVWIDDTLRDKPDAPVGNYTDRWDNRITDCVFAPDTAELITKPQRILLDGVTHEVGLMNSGKSSKALVLTVNRVHAGWHVTLVVESVMKTYEMVSLLRHLDINAVPLVGWSGRAHHAGAYWQSTLSTFPTTFPTRQDPAAAFVNTICLLDPHRQAVDPDYAPLDPEDFPCRGRLRGRTDTGAPGKAVDCPLISICPHQVAERNMADAQVWVTTPQGLLLSKASPAAENMRWLEACQHHTDLMVVDEADRVQKIFDDHFVQTELLVAADQGWADNTLIRQLQGLNRRERLPMRNKDVARFCRLGRDLLEAVDELYSLLVGSEDTSEESSERLRKTLDKNPFTGYSLLRRLTWALFGLPYRESADADDEQAAEDFFRDHLEELALNPLNRPADGLTAVTEAVIGRYRSADDVAVLDAWLVDHAPEDHRLAVKNDLDHLRLLFQAALWSSRITTAFLQMSTLYPAVADLLDMPDADSFWRDQPPADYQPLVPEALMGNLMALQWTRTGTGRTGDLRLMWVRGVGRWLIHHLHDLLEPEGVQGPHVLLTSATSWLRDSSLYNIDIRPTSLLREPPEDQDALRRSIMEYLPARTEEHPVFVSGRLGDDREESLRRITAHILRDRPGQPALLEHIRETLDRDRQQVLFVTLSGDDAEHAAVYANRHTTYQARHVIPNDLQPGEYGLHLRQVHTFGDLDEDVLVAAELAIQRGHNILNTNNTAALGALFYLARPHPPASDLSFPLSLVNQDAMRALLHPVHDPDSIAHAGRELRQRLRRYWHERLGEQVIFRRLRGTVHRAFVANAFASIYQTIGRTIRGGTTTQVFFCDAAFAPRNATPGNAVHDTAHTSLLVAIDTQLHTMLTPPAAGASLDQQRDHVIDTTLYELAHHLFTTIKWPTT